MTTQERGIGHPAETVEYSPDPRTEPLPSEVLDRRVYGAMGFVEKIFEEHAQRPVDPPPHAEGEWIGDQHDAIGILGEPPMEIQYSELDGLRQFIILVGRDGSVGTHMHLQLRDDGLGNISDGYISVRSFDSRRATDGSGNMQMKHHASAVNSREALERLGRTLARFG